MNRGIFRELNELNAVVVLTVLLLRVKVAVAFHFSRLLCMRQVALTSKTENSNTPVLHPLQPL